MNRLSKALAAYGRLAEKYGHPIALKTFVLQRLRWKRPIRVKLFGERIVVRMGSPDLEVAKSSLGGEFAPLEGLFPKTYSGLIVDAGGYIGTAAIKLARFYPMAKIVTIEPSEENFEILLMNVAAFPNITPIRAALVATNRADVKLSNRGTGSWGYTIVDNPTDNPDADFLHSVKTITVADIKSQYGSGDIGIMKIDIEGAERELFLNSDEDLKSTKAVFVELHDRIIAGCSEAFEAFSKDRTIKRFDGEKYLSTAN